MRRFSNGRLTLACISPRNKVKEKREKGKVWREKKIKGYILLVVEIKLAKQSEEVAGKKRLLIIIIIITLKNALSLLKEEN